MNVYLTIGSKQLMDTGEIPRKTAEAALVRVREVRAHTPVGIRRARDTIEFWTAYLDKWHSNGQVQNIPRHSLDTFKQLYGGETVSREYFNEVNVDTHTVVALLLKQHGLVVKEHTKYNFVTRRTTAPKYTLERELVQIEEPSSETSE